MDSGKTDRVVVELLSGHAEIFGTEMVAHNKYQVNVYFEYLAILILTKTPFHSFKEEPSLQCSLSRGAGCRLALNHILEQLERFLLQVQGSVEVEPYTSKETPMLMYTLKTPL